jgi:hypothetical protein
MKTAKLGAIFLISTIALAGVGASYAWWQEELVIDGSVTLGTFGWEWRFYGYEVTHDYKHLITADVYIEDTSPAGTPGVGHTDNLVIIADDVYPCTDLEIWTDIHFWGSVPGHIYEITYEMTVDDVVVDLPPWMFVLVEVKAGTDDLFTQMGIAPGTVLTLEELVACIVPTQWHESYYLDLFFYIHWIQWDMEFIDPWGQPWGPWPGQTFDVPMDATITFDIAINGCQYNDPVYG